MAVFRAGRTQGLAAKFVFVSKQNVTHTQAHGHEHTVYHSKRHIDVPNLVAGNAPADVASGHRQLDDEVFEK